MQARSSNKLKLKARGFAYVYVGYHGKKEPMFLKNPDIGNFKWWKEFIKNFQISNSSINQPIVCITYDPVNVCPNRP